MVGMIEPRRLQQAIILPGAQDVIWITARRSAADGLPMVKPVERKPFGRGLGAQRDRGFSR
jgi:hypothetical protein